MGESGAGKWAAMRAEMPVASRWVYLDHAAVAPLPRPTAAAMRAWIDQASESGDTVWPAWQQNLNTLRQLVADLIHADPDELALVANTTTGVNLVAEGFPWREGDNVVLLANEFPSNQYPWLNQQRRGVEVRRVEVESGRVDLERIAAQVDGRTRIVALSWVGYASGYRIDVAEVAALAHRHGALLFLDAIQGLGIFPLDVRAAGVDFLAADGHKWMLGPEGAGISYIRRELLDLLAPLGVGWNSVQQAHDFQRIALELRPTAQRYEGGSHNMIGLWGLAASLSFLTSYGVSVTRSEVAERIGELVGLAADLLLNIGARPIGPWEPPHGAGILSFELPGVDLRQVRRQCEQRGVVLSVRGGHLRISPHAYNNREDLERLVAALIEIRQAG